MSKAGSLLLDLIGSSHRTGSAARQSSEVDESAEPHRPSDNIGLNRQFIGSISRELVEALHPFFWVELSERLIAGTSCEFKNFGVFKRWQTKVSFVPTLLLDESINPEFVTVPDMNGRLDVLETAIEAFCRSTMELIRKNSLKYPAKHSNAPCLTLAGVLLEAGLTEIFLNLRPPQTAAIDVMASAAAVAGYHAWVSAFALVLPRGQVEVQDVGSFSMKRGVTSRVDFKAEKSFLALIQANLPRLPETKTA